MKYYSDMLNRIYDTEEELVADETNAKRIKEEAEAKKKMLTETRKDRAKEIDAAREAVIEAEKTYRKLVNAFVKDYGNYHCSFSTKDIDTNFSDLFDSLFKLF